MASPVSGVKRFLFWDYPRAGWQYDVMVGLILAFIFLTPREVVPRSAQGQQHRHASRRTRLQRVLDGLRTTRGRSRGAARHRASALLKARTGKKYNVVRLEPIVDSEQEIKGYMAFTTP